MSTILVVCTGNVCRSPLAEESLRSGLRHRFGTLAPTVGSSGTAGLEGSAPMPETVQAAAERGMDVSRHVARRLTSDRIAEAKLVIGMAAEHRDAVTAWMPETASKVFTLKELVRLVEELPSSPLSDPESDLSERVAAAAALRATGFEGNAHDESVIDPIGMPLESYRAVAWEIDEWTARLLDGIFGRVPAATPASSHLSERWTEDGPMRPNERGEAR